jgi:hypothetical protein
MPLDRHRLERLAVAARTLAGSWGARAAGSTSSGQERALLRLFGVTGLDAAGRPLAGEVVARYIGQDTTRLAGGVALPFAMGLLEYDLGPQELALDVASGAIDLALEAHLLREPDRRAVAEAEAQRLVGAAFARIDANRTARSELLALLGEPPRPWIGTSLVEPVVDDAMVEALRRVTEGLDLLRVEVPVGRELADRLQAAGVEWPSWPSTDGAWPAGAHESNDDGAAPSGSQRGLARLRHALDEIAADRRGYVYLATAAPALAAPEHSIVAGFERIDVVEADPMTEIVAGSVDPDRAIADHVFAHGFLRRAGSLVLVGAGPLVVGPDLTIGVPSSAATRSGRALALQLLGVALARGSGLPAEQIVVGAMPSWLTDEPQPATRAAGEVALRRALLPEHQLAFEEPATTPDLAAAWPFVLAGVLPAADPTAVVVRRPTTGSLDDGVRSSRAASGVAAQLLSAYGERALTGSAEAHADAVATAALETLERLDAAGWRAVLGDALSGGERLRLGGDAVVERTEGFDMLGASPMAPAGRAMEEAR